MTFNRPVCNCPDAAHTQDKNLFSNYFSTTFDRNWKQRTTSDGGTKEFFGIREKGFYCKHENCVLRIRGEVEQAYPDGVPYEPRITPFIVANEKPVMQYQSDYTFIKPISELI